MTKIDLAKSAWLTRHAMANIETCRQAMTAYYVFLVTMALKLKNLNVLHGSLESEFSRPTLRKIGKKSGIMVLADEIQKQCSNVTEFSKPLPRERA